MSINQDLLKYLTDAELTDAEVLNFFILFSRFEYSLIAAGYFNGSDKRVDANWDKFACELRDEWADEYRKIDDDHETKQAVKYLWNSPPQKLVVKTNASGEYVDFESTQSNKNLCDLSLSIRRVRNNLFHGGKYLGNNDTNRNSDLISHSVTVLNDLLRVCHKSQVAKLKRVSDAFI